MGPEVKRKIKSSVASFPRRREFSFLRRCDENSPLKRLTRLGIVAAENVIFY
jgi:hypothetical protein